MTRRAYVYFVVTFIIGVILGGLGMYTFAWNSGRWRRHWNEESALHNMQRQLDLSPQQVGQLRSIWDEGIKENRALTSQLHPQYEAIHQRVDDLTRKILNPVQVKEFDQILLQKRKAKGR
ncbi:MAG: hypothetical protein ACRD19_12100 [Terriglobia bacterium]